MLTIVIYCKITCVNSFTYNGLYLKFKTLKIRKLVLLNVRIGIYTVQGHLTEMCVLGMISFIRAWIKNYLGIIYLFHIELVTR